MPQRGHQQGAFRVPVSLLRGGVLLGSAKKESGLAVSELLLDLHRLVREIELWCVVSETVFGIMGIIILEVL
jgi:hypothetical protein